MVMGPGTSVELAKLMRIRTAARRENDAGAGLGPFRVRARWFPGWTRAPVELLGAMASRVSLADVAVAKNDEFL